MLSGRGGGICSSWSRPTILTRKKKWWCVDRGWMRSLNDLNHPRAPFSTTLLLPSPPLHLCTLDVKKIHTQQTSKTFSFKLIFTILSLSSSSFFSLSILRRNSVLWRNSVLRRNTVLRWNTVLKLSWCSDEKSLRKTF